MIKRKVFGVSIIILGILLLSIPILLTKSLERASKNSLDYFNKMNATDIFKNNTETASGNFNFNEVEEISPTDVLLDPSKINPNLLIGQIKIDSIDLNLTIFKGVSEPNLLAGVGTMKEDQSMGVGNYAIAGHNSRRGALFYRLDEVKVDDIIKITDKNKIYEYRVYETKVVPPTSLYMIEDKEADIIGNPIISLMNCYYENGKNSGNRYFVLGNLTDTYDYEQEKM